MGLRRDTRWWGWGDPEEVAALAPGGESMMREREILPDVAPEPPSLESISLLPPAPLPDSLADLVGSENVHTGHEDRVRHAAGQSLLDLLRLRSGELDQAPDAVIEPASAETIAPLLEICSNEGIAVVPFGGGTSVVGGVAPVRGRFDRLISLDLGNLRRFEVDRVSMTARLGAGLRGPEAEGLLAAEGFTLGHFPQSFEYATIGGFAATRSAGQASCGYGRFDSLVSSVRLVSPSGELSTLATPHSSIGPSMRELIIGSEGIFGVIPDLGVRVRPAPEVRRYEGWIAESFDAGNSIIRSLAQSGGLPTVARVSDEHETEVSVATSTPSGPAGALFRRYLKLRGRSGGSLIIVGFEGTGEEVRRQRARTISALRKGGAIRLGQSVGRGWVKGRYHGPYLREALLDRGVVVETLETAHQWSAHASLYGETAAAIRSAMASCGMKGIVMCHLSHAYPDGASLYFTVISSPGSSGGIVSWPIVKSAAVEAIRRAGGTLSHHHATGRDHAPWLAGEIGELGLEAIAGVKAGLDPEGIMNPGKLLPPLLPG